MVISRSTFAVMGTETLIAYGQPGQISIVHHRDFHTRFYDDDHMF